jgi:DNA invertase Pin-like site-specific DNA recombinase
MTKAFPASPRTDSPAVTGRVTSDMARSSGDAAPSMPNRVALYTTDASGNQEEFLRDYAREHLPHSTVVATYRDEGSPGRTPPMLRPGMRDALAAAAFQQFDILLTERLSRISRRVEHVTDIAGRLSAASVRLITADTEIDTGEPLGHAVMAIAGVLAQDEREQIRDRLQGMREPNQAP